jgi:hypothetical protein
MSHNAFRPLLTSITDADIERKYISICGGSVMIHTYVLCTFVCLLMQKNSSIILYVFRRHKDLKLLLNLLAETSGLPESFRDPSKYKAFKRTSKIKNVSKNLSEHLWDDSASFLQKSLIPCLCGFGPLTI